MGLEGKYEEVKAEGFEEFFKAFSAGRPAPPEGQPRGPPRAESKSLSISISGDQVTIDRGDDRKPTYTLNKEVEVPGFGGKPEKTKASLAGDVLTVESENPENGTFKRVYTLVGSELTVKYSSSKLGLQASRVYKKL